MTRKSEGVDLLPKRHRGARVELIELHSRDRRSEMNVTTYGLDLAKRVFQVHWVEVETGEIKRKTLARAQVLGFFSGRVPGVVVLEAGGSSARGWHEPKSARSLPVGNPVSWRWRPAARRTTGVGY